MTCSFLLLIAALPVLGQQGEVPTDKLRERFFQTLNDRQIVEFTTELDKTKQLTAYELGAKYRWGYIPPDRTPPASLAQWWKSLSPRKKDEHRLKWFRKHYQQLNPDRVARQLGLQDRLTKIFRGLRADYSESPEALESVPFPESDVQPTHANQGSTEFEKIYEQKLNPEQSTDEMDQRPDYLPGSPGESGPRSEGSESTSTRNDSNGDVETQPEDRGTTEKASEKPESTTQSDSPDEQSEPREFASGDLKYRRVGDHIEVIGRINESPSDTSSRETVPEVDASDSVDDDTTSLPRVKPPESSESEGVNIPPPMLRFLESDGRTEDVPELRRFR